MVATIQVNILGNAQGAQQAANQAQSSFQKFGGAMNELAVPAGIAVAAIGTFAKGAVDAASRTEQAMGALESVYGSSAAQVKAWADQASQSVGLSEASYAELASTVGASLQNMGMSQDSAAAKTNELITLGADLAATYGGTTEEAVQALGAAFRGEADPAERFGLALKQSNVEAYLAAKGQDKLEGAAKETARAEAILALATEQAGGAIGAFGREADTTAGAQQRANAAFEDAQADIGEGLLPLMTKLAEALAVVAGWMKENQTLVLVLAGVIGGLAAAVLLINGLLALYSAAQAVATIATTAWSVVSGIASVATTAFGVAMAILTSPITLIILAIGALIAIIYLLIKNWDTVAEAARVCWDKIKEYASAAWEWIKDKANSFFDWIKTAWQAAADFVSGVWEKVKGAAGAAWDWIKDKVTDAWNGIKSAISSVGDWILGVWDKIKSVGVSTWEAIKSAVNALLTPFRMIRDAVQWLIQKLREAWDWAVRVISKIPFIGSSMADSGVSVSAASPLGVTGRASASHRSAGTTINIHGAVDPVGTAKRVQQLLGGQARRTRGVTIGRMVYS